MEARTLCLGCGREVAYPADQKPTHCPICNRAWGRVGVWQMPEYQLYSREPDVRLG